MRIDPPRFSERRALAAVETDCPVHPFQADGGGCRCKRGSVYDGHACSIKKAITSVTWEKIWEVVSAWRLFWASSGVTDTAFFLNQIDTYGFFYQ